MIEGQFFYCFSLLTSYLILFFNKEEDTWQSKSSLKRMPTKIL